MSKRKEIEHEQEEEQCSAAGKIAWFLAGAAVGVVAGMLLAPRSGKDTRDAMTGTGRDVYERTRHIVDDAAELFERGRKLASGGGMW